MMSSDAERVKSALASRGIYVNDVYDLVNAKKTDLNAIPCLLDLLEAGIHDDKVKEGVIRALAVKEARGRLGRVLIEEFQRTPADKVLFRWAIGNTMAVVITPDCVDDILLIVKDRKNGIARQMFVLALAKVPSPEVEQALIDLLDDDDVVAHAISALGKMKSRSSAEKIRQLLSHPRSLIRKEAKLALERISNPSRKSRGR